MYVKKMCINLKANEPPQKNLKANEPLKTPNLQP